MKNLLFFGGLLLCLVGVPGLSNECPTTAVSGDHCVCSTIKRQVKEVPHVKQPEEEEVHGKAVNERKINLEEEDVEPENQAAIREDLGLVGNTVVPEVTELSIAGVTIPQVKLVEETIPEKIPADFQLKEIEDVGVQKKVPEVIPELFTAVSVVPDMSVVPSESIPVPLDTKAVTSIPPLVVATPGSIPSHQMVQTACNGPQPALTYVELQGPNLRQHSAMYRPFAFPRKPLYANNEANMKRVRRPFNHLNRYTLNSAPGYRQTKHSMDTPDLDLSSRDSASDDSMYGYGGFNRRGFVKTSLKSSKLSTGKRYVNHGFGYGYGSKHRSYQQSAPWVNSFEQ